MSHAVGVSQAFGEDTVLVAGLYTDIRQKMIAEEFCRHGDNNLLVCNLASVYGEPDMHRYADYIRGLRYLAETGRAKFSFSMREIIPLGNINRMVLIFADGVTQQQAEQVISSVMLSCQKRKRLLCVCACHDGIFPGLDQAEFAKLYPRAELFRISNSEIRDASLLYKRVSPFLL